MPFLKFNNLLPMMMMNLVFFIAERIVTITFIIFHSIIFNHKVVFFHFLFLRVFIIVLLLFFLSILFTHFMSWIISHFMYFYCKFLPVMDILQHPLHLEFFKSFIYLLNYPIPYLHHYQHFFH